VENGNSFPPSNIREKHEKEKREPKLNGKVQREICMRQMWKSTHNYSASGAKEVKNGKSISGKNK